MYFTKYDYIFEWGFLMGWSGGGGANPDNETIKLNTQGQLFVQPATDLGGSTDTTGVGVKIDGSTLVNTSGTIGVSTAYQGGLSPANYIGTANGSDPASPTLGQWWYRTDLGIIKIYTGATYGAVSAGDNQPMVVATSTLAAGTYADIYVPSGVTLTLSSATTYTFSNIYNYGTISDSGATSTYNGKDGLVNYGTYTVAGSPTIAGVVAGVSVPSLSVPTGNTLTLKNVTVNGNITGAGTLVIPVNTTVLYGSTTAMAWTVSAITVDGELYITSTATGTPNTISSALTYGTNSMLRCDTSLSIADSNCPAPSDVLYTTGADNINIEFFQYPAMAGHLSGVGFVAVSRNITLTAGASTQSLISYNLGSGVSPAGVVGTVHIQGHHITEITAARIGTYGWGSYYSSLSNNNYSGIIYCGNTNSSSVDLRIFDITANTAVTNYAYAGASLDTVANGLPSTIVAGSFSYPDALTVTETFYY